MEAQRTMTGVGPPSYPSGSPEEARDRALAQMLAARFLDGERSDRVPPEAALQAWAAEFGVDGGSLGVAFKAVSAAPKRAGLERLARAQAQLGSEQPERVVPLMWQVRLGRGRAWITHLLQYASMSELELRARVPAGRAGEQIRFAVDIGIEAADGTVYEAGVQSGSSGNGELSRHYVVVPRLPDDLKGVTLRLIPSERGLGPEAHPRLVRLRAPVAFAPRKERA